MIDGRLNTIVVEGDDDTGALRDNDRAIVSAGFDPLGTSNMNAASAAQAVHDAFGSILSPQTGGVAISGQLWIGFGGPGTGTSDGHSDFRVIHADSDGQADSVVIADEQVPTGLYQAVGLDTSAGIFISLDNTYHLRVTPIGGGADLSSTVVASTADQDLMNGFAVNDDTNTIFAGLFGYDYLANGGDLIKMTYNQTTGAITTPYSWNDTTHAFAINLNSVLITSTSTGHVYADARAMQLSNDGNTLYYVDDNDNDPGGFWGFGTNGVFKVSTSGSVGGGNAPTPVLLSLQAQFPTNDSNGYISGLAVDEGRGIIYFTTNSSAPGVNASQNAIWWIPITGGVTATKMTIPGGVSVTYPYFIGEALSLDPNTHQLYYSDQATGLISRFQLSADGHSFTSGATFLNVDTGANNEGAGGMVFDVLPTLAALSPTSTEAVQGGSAITLLTATPTITDVDNLRLNHFSVTVTNAQSGDNLFLNGAQSGTVSGVTISWNSSTHVLTLSGDVAFSTYQTLLNQVSFQDSGTDNSTGSHPTRTINWTASDGVTITHASTDDTNQRTTTVVIDRAPTLTADSYAVLETATSTGTSGTGGTGVLGNDNDKDADAIVVTQVQGSGGNIGNSTAGTYGHLTLNSNGSYSYVADNAAQIAAAANGSHPVDTFSYTVSDGLGGVSSSTVSFTINRNPAAATSNYAVQAAGSVSGTSGTAGTGALGNDTDKDGDSLTVAAVAGSGGNVGGSTAGTYGHLTLNANGSLAYNADGAAAIASGATGSHLVDTFAYTISDAHSGSAGSTVTFTINRGPTGTADAFNVLAAGSVTGTSGTGGTGVLGNDTDKDGDSLSVSALTGGTLGVAKSGTYGQLTLNANGSFTYNANNAAAISAAAAGSHLTDTFSYTVSDGQGATATQNVVFTLDRIPVAGADSYAVQAAGSASGTSGTAGTGVLGNDSDKDGDGLSITAVNSVGGNVGSSVAGTYGHLTLNANGSFSYTADNASAIDAAANGSHPVDSFTYTVSDGQGGTTTQTVSFTINRAPGLTNDSYNAQAAGTVSGTSGTSGTGVLGNDVDKDGDSVTLSAVNGTGGNVGASIAGTYGHLTLNANGSFSYSADNAAAISGAAAGSHPTDTFTYAVSDGQGGTTTASVSFAVNRNPSGTADTSLVFAGATKTGTAGSAGTGVLGNDADTDSDTLSVSALTGGTLGVSLAGTYGHLTLNADGSYSYAADNAAAIAGQPNDAVLTDSFAYAISDGHGGSATNIALTLTVDQAPSVVSFDAATTSSADFATAHTVTFTLATGKNVTVAGGTTLALSDGGTATYVSGSGSQTITFSYIATHAPGALSVSSITSGSIVDAAGNSIVLTGTAVGAYTDAVSDTAASIGAHIDDLQAALANITTISFTDAGTPTVTITSGQQSADGGVLAKLHGPYNLVISDAAGTTPEPGISGTAPHYHAIEYDYDNTTTLIRTVYFNDDGTRSVVNAGSGQTIDDSTSTTNDYFDLSAGSNLTATGGSGDDGFYFGANFAANDHIDGGTGANNQIGLKGDYSGGLTLGATTIANIQVIAVQAGFSYNLTTDDANVASGAKLTVWAVQLGTGDTLTFNGSTETNGSFAVFGGAGKDVVQGGAGNDMFYGLGGADTLTGHGGADVFAYIAVSNSTGNANGTAYDSIDFDANADRFDLPGAVTGIDTAIVGGALSSGNFDANLTAAIGATQLLANHAVLFTPDTGTLATHTFLVVDANGIAGYQSGADYVFDVTAGANLASLTAANFI